MGLREEPSKKISHRSKKHLMDFLGLKLQRKAITEIAKMRIKKNNLIKR
jgi:hypothetical protein